MIKFKSEFFLYFFSKIAKRYNSSTKIIENGKIFVWEIYQYGLKLFLMTVITFFKGSIMKNKLLWELSGCSNKESPGIESMRYARPDTLTSLVLESLKK